MAARLHSLRSKREPLLLLAGDGFSAFGGWIDFLAILTLAAYQFNVSPLQMAVVGAAGLLPGMLVAPLVGRWCDHASPKPVLLLSIAGRAAATAAILACDGFMPFVALVALRSVFATVAPPAINVLAVATVEAAARPRFYAVLNGINNAAKVLAPAIGTVASSLAGEATALALSLACSAAAFAAFAGMAAPAATAPTAAAAAVATDGTVPAVGLLPLLWTAATCAFFIFMVNNLVPLVLQQARLDKALLGVLVGCSGAGNIVASVWLARRPAAGAPQGTFGSVLRPALLQALGFGAIGALLGPVVALANAGLPLLFFLIGMCSARHAIALNVYVSTHHAAAIGAVSGRLQAWQSGMMFVAPLAGAWVLSHRGAPALFACATGVAVLSIALLLALQKLGWQRLQVPKPA